MERSIKIIRIIQAYVIAFGLFYSTIIFVPHFSNIYVLPKLLIVQCAAFIVLLLESIYIFLYKKEDYFKKSDIYLVFILTSSIFSYLVSINKNISLWGEYMNEGLGLFSIFAYISLVWVYNRLETTQKNLTKYFFLASTSIASLYAIDKYLNTNIRPAGLEGQPILSASIIALGFMILIQLLPELRKQTYGQYIPVILAPIFLFALYALQSSSVILSVLIALGAYIVLFFKKKYLISWKRISIILLVVCIIIILFMLRRYGSTKQYSINQRQLELTTALTAIKNETSLTTRYSLLATLFGHGQNTSGHYYRLYKNPIENRGNEWFWQEARIRNNYLELYLTNGIIGLVIFLLPQLLALKKALLKQNSNTAAGILYLLLWQIWYYPQPLVYIMILFFSFEILHEKNSKYKLPSTSYLLLATLFLLVFLGCMYTSSRMLLGEIAFSRSEYKQAVAYNPYNSEYYRLWANYELVSIDSYKKTHKCFDDPKCSRMDILNKYDHILSLLKTSISLNPTQPENYYLYDTAFFHKYLDSPKKEKAVLEQSIANAKKTLSLDPQNPEYTDSVGQAYLEGHMYDKAATYFRQALRVKPDFIQSSRHLEEIKKQINQE